MYYRKSLTLLALGLVAAPVALYAQSNTTAALAGVVRDPEGRPIAGALIRVSSPSLIGGEKIAYSEANGAYRLPGLPPGKYRIVVEAKGRPTMTGSDTLELGRTSTLNWKFPAASAATVEVVATATEVESTPVGLTQNYDTAALANLPTDRSMEAIMNLTPGVNAKSAWGGDRRENAWLMDGMNIGDVSGNSQWLYANPDWFSEVQVGGIGAPAEYGNFNGGYTNALVKRGGNTFEGSFNLYWADAKWEAKSSNRYPGFHTDPLPAKSYDAALNVGGPIIKDKLWFFASAWARQNEITPIGALATDKRSFQNFLAKFTWQAMPSATLEALFEYDGLPETNKDIDNTVEPKASHNQVAPDRMYNLTWTQTMASNLVLTAKISGYNGNYENRPNNGDAPSLNAEASLTTTTLDYFNNNQWYRNNLRSRVEGTLTLDWFKTGLLLPGDSHAFKFGLEQAQASNEDYKTPTAGYQLFGYEGDTPGLLEPDVFDVGGGYNIRMRSNRTAFYVQDTWTLSDRVTLRPGIRYERYQARPFSRGTLWDKKTWAPRFGGTIALTGDQKNLFKFHWGKYYTPFSSWFVDRAHQDMIPVMTEYALYGSPINPFDPSTYPTPVLDPNEIVSVTNDISPVDPNAKQPYTVETTFAFEHKINDAWTVTATWVYREQKDILVRKDMADYPLTPGVNGDWTSVTYDWKGASQTTTYWNSAIDTSNPNGTNWLVTTEPTAKRNYVSGSLVVERKWMDDWSLTASLTRARRYGNMGQSDGYDGWAPYESPNYNINAYGLLPGYHDWEGKIHGAVALPWNLRLSASFTWLTGEHFTPYYRTARQTNGSRTYFFVAPRGSEQYGSEHLLDMRLSETIKFDAKVNLEVFAQVFNVLNTGTTLSFSTERMNSSLYGIPATVEQGRRLQLGVRFNF